MPNAPTGSANHVKPVTFFRSETCTPTGATVGAVSTTVLASNDDRKKAVFTNTSDEDMWLTEGATAEINKGIFLHAYGGQYEINQMNLYTGEVSAICTSGSKLLGVEEGV